MSQYLIDIALRPLFSEELATKLLTHILRDFTAYMAPVPDVAIEATSDATNMVKTSDVATFITPTSNILPHAIHISDASTSITPVSNSLPHTIQASDATTLITPISNLPPQIIHSVSTSTSHADVSLAASIISPTSLADHAIGIAASQIDLLQDSRNLLDNAINILMEHSNVTHAYQQQVLDINPTLPCNFEDISSPIITRHLAHQGEIIHITIPYTPVQKDIQHFQYCIASTINDISFFY